MSALLSAILVFSVIVGLRYLAVSGAFAWLTRRVRPGLIDTPRSLRQQVLERRWSLFAAFIYGAPGGFAFWTWEQFGWTRVYTEFEAYPLWYLPVSVLLYLLAHDTWFYWTHRAMHGRRLFPVVHKVHHDSRPPTAWAAMSFHWTESLSGAVLIPALLYILPIHYAALGVVLAIATFFGVTNHLGWEIFPARLVNGTFGRLMITASHHHRHHQVYNSNYGLYFRFWDRLCGTDRGISGDFGREEVQARRRAAARRAVDGGRRAAGARAASRSEAGRSASDA
jgi:sterol desaturase/sphingolipid hydroxylase (fatty acid hydroxylase superfamily)